MTPLCLEFTWEDAVEAYETWGANCGPGAIAAVCGWSLKELRPHLGDFERKRYTNPTLMFDILRSIKQAWTQVRPIGFPKYGLARIQWHGPWMKEGVPIPARYRHTHWIGVCQKDSGHVGVFDINCLNNGLGWVSFDDWKTIVVPSICAETPKADGQWSVTHGIEIVQRTS